MFSHLYLLQLSSPNENGDHGVQGGQLEIGQPAVRCVLSPLWPTVAACVLCLSAPAVPSAWDGHPALRLGHPCPRLSVLWPLAFAWLWYQIVGIPDEIPCPACVAVQMLPLSPHPQVPSAEPVLVLTLWLSSKVPFLDPPHWVSPSMAAARAGALVSRGSGLV